MGCKEEEKGKSSLMTGPFFKWIGKLGVAYLGTILMAMGINMVYEPLGMVTGGFSGIAILVAHLSSLLGRTIPVWVTTTVLNLPLMIWTVKQRGISYSKNIIFVATAFSLFLSIIPQIPLTKNDYLMGAILGGTLNGVGLGLVFSQGLSTGGTDLLCSLVQRKFPGISVARLLLLVDSFVVAAGIGVFGLQKGLYAVLAVFVTTKVMDAVLEGLKYAKMVFIISEHEEEISRLILHELNRGVTGLERTGMYSGTRGRMLLCVVSRKELVSLVKLVEKCDSEAFLIIADAREVKGEGFKVRS